MSIPPRQGYVKHALKPRSAGARDRGPKADLQPAKSRVRFVRTAAKPLELRNFRTWHTSASLEGRSATAPPQESDFDMLCDIESVVHLDAEVPDCAFGLRVAEK